MKKVLNPKSEGIKINSVNYTKNKNILIRTEKPVDLEKIKNSEALKRESFQFSSPDLKRFRIIIFNVDPGTSKEDLLNEISGNNDTFGNLSSQNFAQQLSPSSQSRQGELTERNTGL